ncbi:MAG: response regulator [Nitrospirota bacterium]
MKKILIADDEEPIRNILTHAVSRLGHRPYTASDGAEAIRLFRENPEIDIAILDLRMPFISGQEVCILLKNLKPDIEIIISSAFVNELIEKELKEMGVKHILHKPYPMTKLQEIIDTI